MPESETVTYLSLGSNLGDRHGNLERATQLLAGRCGSIILRSGVYESPPWGFSSGHSFFNSCLAIKTGLQPDSLLERALGIEKEMGRIRGTTGYSDRIIDIDLLFYGDLVLDRTGLKLPHPGLADRGFVLVPLAEIAPELVHPVSGKCVKELLEACPERSVIIPV